MCLEFTVVLLKDVLVTVGQTNPEFLNLNGILRGYIRLINLTTPKTKHATKLTHICLCLWFVSVIKLTSVIRFFHSLVLKLFGAKEAVKLKGVYFLRVGN